MKIRPPTEKELQGMVVDYWRGAGLPGTRVAAIPNANAFGQPGLTKGLPDLMCWGGSLLEGKTLYIELKTPRGEISPAQTTIHEELRAAGAPIIVCKTFDEAHDVLVGWGICRPLANRSLRQNEGRGE